MPSIIKVVKTSRPFVWLTHITAFIFGAIASSNFHLGLREFLFPIVAFTLPYSLFIYAINDFYDFESDNANPRKGGAYGEKHYKKDLKSLPLQGMMGFVISLVIFISFGFSILAFFVLMSLMLFFYSSPPFRFKSIPVLDVLTGGLLYFFLISLIGFLIYGGSLLTLFSRFPNIMLFGIITATLAHLIGSVVDEDSDKVQGTNTSTVFFGANFVLLFCIALSLFSIMIFFGNILAMIFYSFCIFGFILCLSKKIRHGKFIYYFGQIMIYALSIYAIIGALFNPAMLQF